ncbi:hypothetical protein niasHT_006200 [Heterodera trifolii]|uniref:Uncharacterized protein n=1 Tax=Heterodera trifolii TaxID=157864 RepID=A0ABD2M2J9_9BILA
MRHAMRMFLVPEDVFQSVFVQPKAAGAAAADSADGTPIGLLRSRIQQIERSRELNEEQKAAQYHQEFKRLNKLVREQEEQPINVRLQNEPGRKKSPTPPPPPPPPPQTIHHSTPKKLEKKNAKKTAPSGQAQIAGLPKNKRKKEQQKQQQQQTGVKMEKLKKKRAMEMIMVNSGTMHNHQRRPQRQQVQQK